MGDRSPFRHARADDSAGFLLFKLTTLWQRTLGGIFRELGLTQTQYAILASLRWHEEHQQPTTQTVLAEHARIEPMTLSKAIRKLEQARMLKRDASVADSRAMTVRLTATGRTLTQSAVVAIEQADEEFFGCLNDRELESYKRVVRALVAGNA